LSVSSAASPGLGQLRSTPAGLPAELPTPPQVALSGDPFTRLRVVHLVARLPRGVPLRIADIADRLNATHLDWQFSQRVVADAVIGLATDWLADYRNVNGILIDDGPYGATVTIEDTPRVDPWLVGRSELLLAECHAVLAEFARRDRVTGDG
jgi:hypothetical protein